MIQTGLGNRRAFTLIELLVVIAIVALLLGILLPALGTARKVTREVVCGNNLRQIGEATNSYATEFQDRIFAFTWNNDPSRGGVSRYADLEAQRRSAAGGTAAASAQAVDIMRRRAGREDIPRIDGWIPHVYYTHLVLQDYLASRLPEKLVLCPEDRARAEWQQENGAKFDRGEFLPLQPAATATNKRWTYSSSYQTNPASYDWHASRLQAASAPNRITIATSGSYWVPGNSRLGGLFFSDMQFPAQKVLYHDEFGRHKGKFGLYWGYDDSVQPLLFFDASVTNYVSRETNRGWIPTSPQTQQPTRFVFTPDVWEPPLRDGTYPSALGGGGDLVIAYYLHTRGGLKGADVQSGEIRAGRSTWP